MLRAFVADCYAAESLNDVATQLQAVMPDATVAQRLAAAQVPMLLADLVDAIEAIVVLATELPQVRGFAGGLLTYVYNPLDLVQADGVSGWIDDAIVCAVGVRRLHREGVVALDEGTLALCDSACASEPRLSNELRESIAIFIDGLWTSSGLIVDATRERIDVNVETESE